MKYKNVEKEIIKALVKYESKAGTIADALTQSKVLERHGVVIVPKGYEFLAFFDKELYHDWDNIGYLAELLSVIDSLLTGRDILLISQKGPCHVIGKKQAEYIKLNVILVDGKDYIVTEGAYGPNYFNSNKQQAYWPNTFPDNHFKFPVSKLAYSYSISQELKELVKHNFKSEEEIRFSKQQFVSWVAIGVSLLLGILGVIF